MFDKGTNVCRILPALYWRDWFLMCLAVRNILSLENLKRSLFFNGLGNFAH